MIGARTAATNEVRLISCHEMKAPAAGPPSQPGYTRIRSGWPQKSGNSNRQYDVLTPLDTPQKTLCALMELLPKGG
jgi:hypothetical protein